MSFSAMESIEVGRASLVLSWALVIGVRVDPWRVGLVVISVELDGFASMIIPFFTTEVQLLLVKFSEGRTCGRGAQRGTVGASGLDSVMVRVELLRVFIRSKRRGQDPQVASWAPPQRQQQGFDLQSLIRCSLEPHLRHLLDVLLHCEDK